MGTPSTDETGMLTLTSNTDQHECSEGASVEGTFATGTCVDFDDGTYAIVDCDGGDVSIWIYGDDTECDDFVAKMTVSNGACMP